MYLERFKAKLIMGAAGECWPWPGEKKKVNGYGVISLWGENRRTGRMLAHRVAWWAFSGEPPPSHLEVCHACDNPPCCNPGHLFLGTHAENMADAWAKKRVPPPPRNDSAGARHGMSKLTAADVLAIRADARDHTATAAAFGVSRRQVADIRKRRAWRCL